MRAQIRGLNTASLNIQDGISFVQTTEGAINEVHSLLQRGYELSVQASNDTYVDSDRESIQEEINQIIKEIDRIANEAEFNNIKVFGHVGNTTLPIMENGKNSIYIDNKFQVDGVTQTVVSTTNKDPVSYIGNDAILAEDVKMIAQGVGHNIIHKFSSLYRAGSISKIGLNLDKIDGVNGTLASASVNISVETNSNGYEFINMEYSLNIDLEDFPSGSYNKDDLASTIAHEMMHIVMYDIFTSGMAGNDPYPQWLIEGLAQVVGGGMTAGHNSNIHTFNDAQMESYLSNFKSDVYGAGYLVTMYLGQAVYRGANGSVATSFSENEAINGLNKFLGELVDGKSLDQVIADNTIYSGLQDFQNSVASDAVKMSQDLAKYVNDNNGAGSLLVGVARPANDIYTTSTGANKTKYEIDVTSQSVSNKFQTKPALPPGISSLQSGYIIFQVGANKGQLISCNIYDISSKALGLKGVSVVNSNSASSAITSFNNAIESVSKVRSYYGAIQNRLEYTMKNVNNTSENLQSSESLIRDVNMAKEIMSYSKNNILQQSSMSMLYQSKQRSENILSLIG